MSIKISSGLFPKILRTILRFFPEHLFDLSGLLKKMLRENQKTVPDYFPCGQPLVLKIVRSILGFSAEKILNR